MPFGELEKAITRGLLKAAKAFEKNPVAVTLLFCQPLELYDLNSRSKFGLRGQSVDKVGRTLKKLGNGAEYLFDIDKQKINHEIKSEIRREVFHADVVDQGLSALRYMNEVLAVAESLEKVLVPPPKKPLKGIEALRKVDEKKTKIRAGDILISHPWSCLSQDEYHQSVILICNVRERDGAVLGLVLNRATACGIFHGGSCPMPDGSLMALAKLSSQHSPKRPPSFFSTQSLNRIFPHDDLIFVLDEQERTNFPASDFKLFRGYASWESLQLETELSRGVWLQCRAPSRHIISLALAGSDKNQFSSPSQAHEFDQFFWMSALTAVTGRPELADYTVMDQENARYTLKNLLRRHYRDLHAAMRRSEDISSIKDTRLSPSTTSSGFPSSPFEEEGS